MRMMWTFCCYVAVIIAVCMCSTSLQGQDQQNFKKIFDKETSSESAAPDSVKFRNVEVLSFYPDTLPSWFFTQPASVSDFYAIGISDPDMDSTSAKELAIHRAKANALLFSNARVQYYRDIYSTAQDDGRYAGVRQQFDTYFKISVSSMVSNAMFSVVDTHFTRYNEYIALVKYSPAIVNADSAYNLTVMGTSFFVEASVDDAFEEQAEYEIMSIAQMGQSNSCKAHYLYREKGNRSLSSSSFKEQEVTYPVYAYIYASPQWGSVRHAFTSYNGLWSIYTRQLLRYLTLNSQQSSIKLRNVGEQYSSRLSNLTREIASFTGQLNINGINFDSDTLKFDIQLKELNQFVK